VLSSIVLIGTQINVIHDGSTAVHAPFTSTGASFSGVNEERLHHRSKRVPGTLRQAAVQSTPPGAGCISAESNGPRRHTSRAKTEEEATGGRDSQPIAQPSATAFTHAAGLRMGRPMNSPAVPSIAPDSRIFCKKICALASWRCRIASVTTRSR